MSRAYFGKPEKDEAVWVDGNHRAFEKSDYQGADNFKLKVTPLLRKQQKIYRKKFTNRNGIDWDAYVEYVFRNHVKDWEIEFEKDVPMEFKEENIDYMVTTFPDFTNRVANACTDVYARIEDDPQDEKQTEDTARKNLKKSASTA